MEKRLQRLLSEAGLCSRRKAEEWIRAGRVTVDGVVAELGMRADLNVQTVVVDGTVLNCREKIMTILLHKPIGYVTTLSDEKGRKTVADLVKEAGVRLYPVGRLDYWSEGLLLMTNDGELANSLIHPSHLVDKTYEVWVKGEVTDRILQKLRMPMTLDGYTITPAQVQFIKFEEGKTHLSVVIHEGRNRQIRKMCELCGLTVCRLKRWAIGRLTLGTLPPGQWRNLTKEELAYLKTLGKTQEMK